MRLTMRPDRSLRALGMAGLCVIRIRPRGKPRVRLDYVSASRSSA